MKKGFLHTFVVVMVFGVFLSFPGSIFASVSTPSTQSGASIGSVQVQGVTPTTGPIGRESIDQSKDGWFTNGMQSLFLAWMIYSSKGVAWIVSFTGNLFDKVIEYTTGTKFFDSVGEGVTASWRIIRDFSNIILVFSLLYLGIKTILDGQGFADKKVLIGIIIAAIMINFSLFFVKDIAFNVSNVVGQQILSQANINGKDESISASLMGMVDAQKVLENNNFKGDWGAYNIAEQGRTDWNLVFRMMGQMLMFTAITVCMAFVFLGASVILLYRFFIFIVLMIFSPIGLISTQIPWLSKMGKDWWEQLKKQTLFFPAFSLILYIILLIVTTLAQSKSLDTVNSAATYGDSMFDFLFNFILIIGFMFLLLILPGRFSIAGSDLMTNSGKFIKDKLPRKVGGFGGRMVATGAARTGRAVGGGIIGRSMKDSKTMKNLAQSDNAFKRFIGQTGLKTGAGLQNRTYDVRNLGVVKNSKIGKEMGKGIDGWSKTVDAKKKTLEKQKKDEMKLFGFDKMADTQENKADIALNESTRDTQAQTVRTAKTLYDRTISQVSANAAARGGVITTAERAQIQADQAAYKAEEDKLEKIEQAIGQLKNKGEFEYMKQLERRMFGHGGSRPSATTQSAFYGSMEDLNKKWKKEGQSSQKKAQQARNNQINAALNPGIPPVPPPTPPPPTP